MSAFGGGDDSSSDLGFDDESDDDDEGDGDGDGGDANAAKAPEKPSLDKWSTDQVVEWLRSKADLFPNIDDIVQRFVEDDIDGVALPMLEKSDLIRLGIVKIGQQKKWYRAVEELTGEPAK